MDTDEACPYNLKKAVGFLCRFVKHKYYYNRSIKDGYTLRLIREGIKTEYHLKLQGVLESIKAMKWASFLFSQEVIY